MYAKKSSDDNILKVEGREKMSPNIETPIENILTK